MKPYRNSMYVKKSLNMRNLSTCRFWMFLTWKISTSRLIQKKPLKNLKEFRLLEQRCNNTHEVQEGIPSAVGFPPNGSTGEPPLPTPQKNQVSIHTERSNWKIKGLSSMIVSCSIGYLGYRFWLENYLLYSYTLLLKDRFEHTHSFFQEIFDIHKRFPRNHGCMKWVLARPHTFEPNIRPTIQKISSNTVFHTVTQNDPAHQWIWKINGKIYL